MAGVPHESLRGKLLLSAPSLFDPNFRRTVTLVAEHTGGGAMGLVLNRPGDVAVGDAVPGLAWLAPDREEPVYAGGPVAADSVIVLAEFDDPSLAAVMIFGDVGFVPASAEDHDGIGAALRRSRVFAGHAGWGPGQLEAELDENAWIVEPATSDDVFAPDPDALWADVMRRKGDAYRLLANMPLDPSAN